MKRLHLLFGILICFFTISSCNDSTTKSNTTLKDSAKTDTTKKVTYVAPPIDISFYELEEGMAIKMKSWKNGCPHGNRKDPTRMDEIAGVKQAINDQHPGCTFQIVEARFKEKDDADFYCKINHFESKPGYCDVKNYKTWIYLVTCPGYSETYYEFVTICPPPEPCPATKMNSTK